MGTHLNLFDDARNEPPGSIASLRSPVFASRDEQHGGRADGMARLSLQDAVGANRWSPEGRRVLAGQFPQPVFQMQLSAEYGICIESYLTHDVDALVESTEHVISIFFRDVRCLLQERHGRRCQRPIRAGEIVVTPAGAPKRWRYDGDADYLVVRFPPAFLAHLCALEPGDGTCAPAIEDNFGTRDLYLERLFVRLRDEAQGSEVGNAACSLAIVVELAVHLLRHYREHAPPSAQEASTQATHGRHRSTPDVASSPDVASRLDVASRPEAPWMSRKRLLRAIEYIEDNLHRNPALDDIAAELAMSTSHFSHAFRQTVGCPPHRYVLDRRVELAKALLRDDGVPLAEIARRVGCSSPANFSELFRRATGKSPRSYRNSC